MARFYRELAGLATDYITHKRRQLNRGTPKTVTDSGGNITEYTWSGHDLNQNRLRKVKQIRETGGIVAFLFEAKATMRFGTGAELQAEDDDVQTFLNESFGNVDLLTLDLGADATWYPYAPAEFVETRGGDFSHIEPIEPWTMLPQTDQHGEIVAWEQHTQAEHGDPTVFQPSEIASITLNKSAARDRVGVSEVLRSEEEITQYKQNQEAVNKAIEIAGFPHHIWTVGSEGRTPVDDTDLRRVRNLIDNMDGDTQFVVGPDVDHDKITAAEFDFEGVTRRDLRILTTAVGLPLEIAGYGREGLGSGSEADLIMSLLALQNEVTRRRYEVQFVDEFVRPVVEEYSAYPADEADIEMHIPAFLDDQSELTELIQKVGDYMSTAEVRERLDLPPLEDEEMAESYRSPQQVEEAEEGPDDADGPFGGMFSADQQRQLQDVPDNAVAINDPSEAPPDANIIQGPQGGTYYVPGAGGEDGDTGGGTGNIEEELDDIQSGEETTVDATVTIGGEDVDIGGDEVEVLDAFPDIGMLVEHPEHGRLEVDKEDINDIGGEPSDDGEAPDPPDPDPSPDPDAGTNDATHESFEDGFSLGDSVEQQSLADIGASQGKTAEHMTVHEMEDGETAFVKEFGEDAIDPVSRDQTLAGYEVMKQVAPEQVPSHAVVDDGEAVAVRGVDGVEVGSVPDDVEVDEDAFARGGAAQVLMGNDDARPENVLVTPDGDPMFVDLDEAGDRFGNVRPEDDFRDGFRRAAKSMSQATGVDAATAIDRMAEEAIEMRDEVDADAVSGAVEGQGDVVAEYLGAADEETLMQAAEDAKEYLGVA